MVDVRTYEVGMRRHRPYTIYCKKKRKTKFRKRTIPTERPPLIGEVFVIIYYLVGTAATPGLLCQPQVIVKMIVEKQVECRLVGETEVLGENLPQRYFCPS
jgi:hypothetical protein